MRAIFENDFWGTAMVSHCLSNPLNNKEENREASLINLPSRLAYAYTFWQARTVRIIIVIHRFGVTLCVFDLAEKLLDSGLYLVYSLLTLIRRCNMLCSYATLDDSSLAEIKAFEMETGKRLLAYTSRDIGIDDLTEDQVGELHKLEDKLSVQLVAVK